MVCCIDLSCCSRATVSRFPGWIVVGQRTFSPQHQMYIHQIYPTYMQVACKSINSEWDIHNSTQKRNLLNVPVCRGEYWLQTFSNRTHCDPSNCNFLLWYTAGGCLHCCWHAQHWCKWLVVCLLCIDLSCRCRAAESRRPGWIAACRSPSSPQHQMCTHQIDPKYIEAACKSINSEWIDHDISRRTNFLDVPVRRGTDSPQRFANRTPCDASNCNFLVWHAADGCYMSCWHVQHWCKWLDGRLLHRFVMSPLRRRKSLPGMNSCRSESFQPAASNVHAPDWYKIHWSSM